MQQLLNVLGGMFAVIAFIPYIAAILRRETKPSKATWIIWTLLSVLTALAMYSAGTLNFQMAAIALCDLVVVLLALWYGTSGWTKLDLGCLLGAAIGMAAWIVMSDPKFAIVLAMVVVVIGTIPTVKKTWRHPEQEDRTAYLLMVLSCIVTIAAIPAWTLEDALQPLVYFGVGATILSLIMARPKYVAIAK